MTLPIEINGPILELESLDLYCEDPKSFEEKMRRAIGILDSNNIDPKSNYRRRLKTVEERAKIAFEEKQREDEEWNIPVEKKQSPTLIYRGLLEKYLIRVCVYPEGYYVKKFPDKNKDVSFRWKFNSKGRLENLDLTTRSGSDPIVSLKGAVETPDWTSSQIDTYPIPEKALPFVSRFQNNPQHIVYGILIRFGHKSISNLLKDLSSRRIRDSYIADPEINLAKIVENRHAMKMMRATASIFPYTDLDNSGKCVLRYELNRGNDMR